MRILKKTILIIIAFIAMVLAIALFLPSTFSISRSIEINTSSKTVYNQVSDFSTWKEWAPWNIKDPISKNSFTGIAGQQGHSNHFTGEEMGDGTITISECNPFSLIVNKINIASPAKMQLDDIWKFDTTENGTNVTWTSKGELDYPLGRLYGLMINQLLGDEMETGLDSLKSYSEAIIEEPVISPKDLLIEQEHSE